MPKSFYDGVRERGFWVLRDMYFPACDEPAAKARIDDVIDEVEAAEGFDVIFAWEFGMEYQPSVCPGLAQFLEDMCSYVKSHTKIPTGRSKWVTWGSWNRADPLYTDPGGSPIDVSCLDYRSYNAYPYDPEHIRDHQGGHATGTPYAGYLAALKQYLPDKPLVVTETGLPDSPSVGGWEHPKLRPWPPAYRFGGLNSEQVAEGLADRYWDARLLGNVAGLAYFEWNDEWWKCEEEGAPCQHALDLDKAPEEYFGLLSFDKHDHNVIDTARFKLQQQTARDLYTMRRETLQVTVTPDDGSIPKNGSTTIRAEVSGAVAPVRFRWESSRGYVVGTSDTVEFLAGPRALGPATVTAIAVDANNRTDRGSSVVGITTSGTPDIEVLTLGEGSLSEARASGRVRDVDLTAYKAILYMETDKLYIQPLNVMKSIWIRPDGYWWTQVENNYSGNLLSWLVPVAFDPPNEVPLGWAPAEAIAFDRMDGSNDTDNDLLPDPWELSSFGSLTTYGRYGDPDDDLRDNLEEFLAGTDPNVGDNDSDLDDLPDTWEYGYFGTLSYDQYSDPDGDGLDNESELALGIHPGRTAVDRDRDELPDTWEFYWYGSLGRGPGDDPDGDGSSNLEEYELGTSPVQVPAMSIQGLVSLCLLIGASGAVVLRRR
jgi:hypothetical protein